MAPFAQLRIEFLESLIGGAVGSSGRGEGGELRLSGASLRVREFGPDLAAKELGGEHGVKPFAIGTEPHVIAAAPAAWDRNNEEPSSRLYFFSGGRMFSNFGPTTLFVNSSCFFRASTISRSLI